MPNAINPDHYKRLDPEPIVVIERWDLGFCAGNAIKYIARAGHKAGAYEIEDLAKARWYLDRLLQQRGAELETVQVRNKDLLDELEFERTEAKRWKIIARSLADRVRELTGEVLAEATESSKPR